MKKELIHWGGEHLKGDGVSCSGCGSPFSNGDELMVRPIDESHQILRTKLIACHDLVFWGELEYDPQNGRHRPMTGQACSSKTRFCSPDGSNLTSGVDLCRLQALNVAETKSCCSFGEHPIDSPVRSVRRAFLFQLTYSSALEFFHSTSRRTLCGKMITQR